MGDISVSHTYEGERLTQMLAPATFESRCSIPTRKDDQAMQEALKKHNVTCLWHFTDERNLKSIREHGLLSLKELARRNIPPVAPGGNDWSHKADVRANVDDYVHLSFKKDHPMLHFAKNEERIANHVWLEINLSVIDANTRYTNDVANKANVVILENDTAKKSIDLDGLFTYLPFDVPGNKERKNSAAKSEVLVKTMIGIDKIKGL